MKAEKREQQVRVAFRLPARLLAEIDRRAKAEDRTRSWIVKRILTRELLPVARRESEEGTG